MAEATVSGTESADKVGNPICESCEEDRKNASINSKRAIVDDCTPLMLKVEECAKVSGHRVQACFKEWREFAQCKKHWIAVDRGFINNAPKAPEQWLERHPEFRPYEPGQSTKQQSNSKSQGRYAEHYHNYSK